MNQKTMKQIILFVIVGVLTTLVDWVLTYLLVYQVHLNYVISVAIAFILASIFSYRASMQYVFDSKFTEGEKKREFIIFITLCLLGLLLTEVLMVLLVSIFGETYLMASKVASTVVVMVFNFVSRKLIFEENEKAGGDING